MGNGRALFGRRSGTGRKTYKCPRCGKTARFGLPDSPMPEHTGSPACPCGARMALFTPPSKNRGAGKNKPKWPRVWYGAPKVAGNDRLPGESLAECQTRVALLGKIRAAVGGGAYVEPNGKGDPSSGETADWWAVYSVLPGGPKGASKETRLASGPTREAALHAALSAVEA